MRQTELTLVWNCTLKILSVLLERHSNVSRTAWDWKLLWFKYIKNIPKEDALSGRASKPERQPQQPGPKEGTLNGLVPAGLKGSLTSAFKIALYPFILFCSHWAATVEHRNIQAALREKRLENNEPWEQFYLHHFPHECYDQNMYLLRTQIPSNFFIAHRLWKVLIHGELEPKAGAQNFPDSHLGTASSMHLGMFSTTQTWPPNFWQWDPICSLPKAWWPGSL